MHTAAFVTNRWNRIAPLWFIISVYILMELQEFRYDIGRVLYRSMALAIVAPNYTLRILPFPRTLNADMIHLIFPNAAIRTVTCSI